LTSFVAKRRDGVIGRNDLIGIVFIPCPRGRFPLTALRFLESGACCEIFSLAITGC
jgi:hypothetical protein